MEEFPGCGAADYAEDCQRLSGRSGVPRSEVTTSESAEASWKDQTEMVGHI